MTRRLLAAVLGVFALLALSVPFAVSSWAVNQPPAWTLPTGLTTHQNQDLVITGVSVTSPQSEDLAVQIGLDAHGTIKVDNPPSTAVCGLPPYPNGTFCFISPADPTQSAALVNFRGTPAQIDQALASLTYTPDPGFPQPADGTLLDTLKFSATEQNIANPLTGSLQTDVLVEPPNTAPSFDAAPDPVNGLSTNENQNYDFINELHVTDDQSYTCDPSMDVQRNALITATGGGTWTDSYVSATAVITGGGSSVLSITGDITDINNAFMSLRYHPMPNLAYTDPVTVHFDDAGCVGYPGNLVADTAFPMNVQPGTVTHLKVTAPASAVKGASFNVVVQGLDQYDQVDTNYTGTVSITSGDAAASLPAAAALVKGAGTFSVTLNTTGNQTVTATDTATPALTDTATVNVTNAPATHFVVSGPPTATAGVPVSISVSARDASNQVVPTYAGTVHFTSTDPAASLHADAVLVNGAGTFSTTLNTAGNRTVTATDTVVSSITGTSGAIVVSNAPPPPATHFSVTAPATVTANQSFNVVVTALDAANAVVPAYSGTVHLTSSDGAASLAADATLVNGTGSFATTLSTLGSQTVTATDTLTASITGTSGTITVNAAPPGPATHLVVSAPASAVAGTPVSVTVTAEDAANATATSYSGTVHLTASDGAAVLPADATLTNGSGTFSVTLATSGSQMVTVTDTVTASINGTSGPIVVAAGAPAQMKVSPPPAGAKAGVPFSLTVTVVDQFGNVVTAYSGTVHFGSTDPNAVLPADSSLVNGVGTFMVTFMTAGMQSVSVADVNDAALAGASIATSILPADPQVTTTTTSTTAPTSTTSTTAPGASTTTTAPAGDTTSTVLAGDVNGDGVVDARDVVAAPAVSGIGSGSPTPVYSTTTTGALPITGSDPGPLLVIGLAMIVGGLVLALRFGRRHS